MKKFMDYLKSTKYNTEKELPASSRVAIKNSGNKSKTGSVICGSPTRQSC